jgi:hypothetical protein
MKLYFPKLFLPYIEKVDKRYGRIYLNEAISVSSVVTTNKNYSFKTKGYLCY